MILPIFAYGQPVLKKKALPISAEYPDLETLIANMWETMYHANGVGLAAPQIGLGIRLFVVDTLQIAEKEKESTEIGIKKVFINAEILSESGVPCGYEEGCLSIPDIRGDVERLPDIRLRYYDEQFQLREEEFTGFNARVIQHEYDHIDGVLFVERLKPLKRRLIQRKLDAIRMGKVQSDYKMKFAFR
jgi:peptide deformylase